MPEKPHVISATDLDAETLGRLFARAQDFENRQDTRWDTLNGRIMANVFYEASTRTFSSFEVAMKRLGGSTIPIHDAANISSAAKGESLSDMLRMFEGYGVDAIVVRHPGDDELANAVKHISIPVINAGSGKKEHPTQAFLDLYTIWSAVESGRFSLRDEGFNFLFFGDNSRSRTVRSLATLLAVHGSRFGIPVNHVSFQGPRGTGAPPTEVTTALAAANIPFDVYEPDEGITADIAYITRSQKERGGGNEVEVFSEIHLAELPDDAIIMHPLPRNEELPASIDQDPRAWYFKQAQNGLFVRMALLETLIA